MRNKTTYKIKAESLAQDLAIILAHAERNMKRRLDDVHWQSYCKGQYRQALQLVKWQVWSDHRFSRVFGAAIRQARIVYV